MTAGTGIEFDPDQHHAFTPDGSYRYQRYGDGNMFVVWRREHDDTWVPDLMVEVGPDGTPQLAGLPPGSTEVSTVETYIRAAGHIWAAGTAGLWSIS